MARHRDKDMLGQQIQILFTSGTHPSAKEPFESGKLLGCCIDLLYVADDTFLLRLRVEGHLSADCQEQR